jgi:hypothetical protein
LYIAAGGKVGIGTATPGYPLDVNGNIRATNIFATTKVWAGTVSAQSISDNEYLNLVGGVNVGIRFYLGGSSEKMRLASNGNIGIGSANPEAQLQVTGGGLCVGSDENCNSDNNTEGYVYAAQTAMTVYDVAENYPTKDFTLEAGEVVSLDKDYGVFVKRSESSYGGNILGVISAEPGVLLGGFNGQQFKEDHQVAVALSGRVPVKVSLENGEIAIGDSLTSASSIPGAAMKATAAGRVIGIALESSESCTNVEDCQLMVFINPHWQGGDLTVQTDENNQLIEIDVQSELNSLGLIVNEYGVLEVEVLKAGKVITDGLEMTDKATGETYCIWIENGDWQKVKGECDSIETISPEEIITEVVAGTTTKEIIIPDEIVIPNQATTTTEATTTEPAQDEQDLEEPPAEEPPAEEPPAEEPPAEE